MMVFGKEEVAKGVELRGEVIFSMFYETTIYWPKAEPDIAHLADLVL